MAAKQARRTAASLIVIILSIPFLPFDTSQNVNCVTAHTQTIWRRSLCSASKYVAVVARRTYRRHVVSTCFKDTDSASALTERQLSPLHTKHPGARRSVSRTFSCNIIYASLSRSFGLEPVHCFAGPMRSTLSEVEVNGAE